MQKKKISCYIFKISEIFFVDEKNEKMWSEGSNKEDPLLSRSKYNEIEVNLSIFMFIFLKNSNFHTTAIFVSVHVVNIRIAIFEKKNFE